MQSRHGLLPQFIRLGRQLSLLWILSICLCAYLGQGMPRRVIAFVKQVDYRYQLHVMDVERGVVRRIGDMPIRGCCPIWSPDGTRIAFNGNDRQPYVVDVYKGVSRRLIPAEGTGWVAAWSPDSQSLILTNTGTVRGFYRINADGANLRRLSDNQFDSIMPVWSPDGTRILFLFSPRSTWELYVMDPDGQNQRAHTDKADTYDVDWLP